MNVGDWVLIVLGTAMIAPGWPNTMLYAAEFDGGELTGSGKPETPCARMHVASRSTCAFCSADASGGLVAPGGSSERQARCAALKAGAPGLNPAPVGNENPPPTGSGKFGTPCARMQLANLTAMAKSRALVADLLDEDEPPHAATIAAQPNTTKNNLTAPFLRGAR